STGDSSGAFNGLLYQAAWASHGTWVGGTDWRNQSTFLSGDFNGDGKTDIMYVFKDGTTTYASMTGYLSTGHSFVDSPWSTRQTGWNDPRYAGIFVRGDFNGDGKTDIVSVHGYGNGQGFNVQTDVFVSNGSSLTLGWSSILPNSTWFNYGAAWQPYMAFLLGDFNGDGKVDIVQAWNNGGNRQYDLFKNDSYSPDLLTTWSNGLGGSATFYYSPAPQVPGVIQPGSTQPGVPNTSPQQLLTYILTYDG